MASSSDKKPAKARKNSSISKSKKATKKAASKKSTTVAQSKKSAAKATKTSAKARKSPKTAKKAGAKSTRKSVKKAAPKKAAAAKKLPKKAAKKTTAKTVKSVAKKKKGAAKKPAVTKRSRRASVPAEPVVLASMKSEKDEVVLAYPQSTLVGAEPHSAEAASSAVIAIRSAKYELTPPERVIEPVYPEEGATELPQRYDDTRLVVLVRDPEWLFLYWEIGSADRDMLGMAPEHFINSLVVRLHDVTEVEEFNGVNSVNWYEIPVGGSAVSWYVHLPKVDREWVAELGVLNEEGEFIQICRSNRARTPRNTFSELEDAEWMNISEEFHEILARSADVSLEERSSISTEAALRRIVQRLRITLSGQEGSPGGSDSFRARHGRAKVGGNGAPDLPLTVRTELIVSGATDPSARLTIQGMPVELRPDGSFTTRFELPDGEQVIDVRATNTDESITREIVPVVQKETRA